MRNFDLTHQQLSTLPPIVRPYTEVTYQPDTVEPTPIRPSESRLRMVRVPGILLSRSLLIESPTTPLPLRAPPLALPAPPANDYAI